MKDDIIVVPISTISLMREKMENVELKNPYEKEIHLFDTYIAGTTHIEKIDEIVEKLELEEQLNFFREVNNEYDRDAIVIKTKHKEKIGYIPQSDNLIFSRLMDAGKLLFGKVKHMEKQGNWHKISIQIYLKD